jgi:hypothetical protein
MQVSCGALVFLALISALLGAIYAKVHTNGNEKPEANDKTRDDILHMQLGSMFGIADNEESGRDPHINSAKGGILPQLVQEIKVKAPPVNSKFEKVLTNGKVGKEEFDTQFDDMPGLLSEKNSKEDLQIDVEYSSTPEPQRIIGIQKKTEPEGHPKELVEAPLKDLPEEFSVLEKFGNIFQLQSADADRNIELEETPEPKAVAPKPEAAIPASKGHNGEIGDGEYEGQFDGMPGVGSRQPKEFLPSGGNIKATEAKKEPEAPKHVKEELEGPDYNGDLSESHLFGKIADLKPNDLDTNFVDADNPELKAVVSRTEVAIPVTKGHNGEIGDDEYEGQFDGMPGVGSRQPKEFLPSGGNIRVTEVKKEPEVPEHVEKKPEGPVYNGDLGEPHFFGKIADLKPNDLDTNFVDADNPELKAVVSRTEVDIPVTKGHNGEIGDDEYEGQFDGMPGVGSRQPKEFLPSGGNIRATEVKKEPEVPEHVEKKPEGPVYNGDLGEPHFFGKIADLKSVGLDIDLADADNPELKAVRPKSSIADNGLVDFTEFSHGTLPDTEIGTTHDHAESPEPRAKVKATKNDGHNGDILGEVFTKFVQDENLATDIDQPNTPEPKVARVITQKDNGLDANEEFDGHDGELARVRKGGVSVDSIIENAKAEARDFVSEKEQKEDAKINKPSPINTGEHEPSRDDFQAQFDGMPGVHFGRLDTDANIHDAAAQARALPRITKVEDIPRVAVVHQMVAEAPIITDQAPIDILGDNDVNNKPRLSGVTTFTHTSSGVTSTSIATVTFDPTHTKILSCIFGCSTLVVTTPVGKIGIAKMEDSTTITILPVTVPCSLVICPPCGCSSKIISVTGCPVITTSTPASSFVTVTADFTITFITTTVTVTSCTATTCLTPSTLTITTTGNGSTSTTTLTQTSTISITTITSYSTTKVTTHVEPDEGCPCGYDYTSTSEKQKQRCGCEPTTSIIPPDCPCQQQEECEGCGCGCEDGGDNDDGEYYEIGYYNFKVAQGTVGQSKKAKKGSIKRPVAPPAVTRTITGEVCSTFIVCNPKQFSCPAQITDGKVLPTFLAEWGLLSGQIPNGGASLENSQPTGSYMGFDGKVHGLGSGMVFNSSSSHHHVDEVKGIKIVKDANVVFGAMTTAMAGDDTKSGQFQAAKRNGAPSSSSWMGLPTLAIIMATAWMFL